MNGIELIAQERQRQIVREGYDHAHDDAHDQGELAAAAIAYASPFESIKAKSLINGDHICDVWPFELDGFKPKDRISDLVRAGALIAAEIDRLQRAGVNP